MTALVSTVLRCDNPGCPATCRVDGWPAQARTEARRSGWTCGEGDRCPAHPVGGDTPATLFDVVPWPPVQ